MAEGNLVKPRAHSADELFHSPAFLLGFKDGLMRRPFKCPDNAKGPNPSRRSAEIAYERGRQFAVIWGERSIANVTRMIQALKEAHEQKLIL